MVFGKVKILRKNKGMQGNTKWCSEQHFEVEWSQKVLNESNKGHFIVLKATFQK